MSDAFAFTVALAARLRSPRGRESRNRANVGSLRSMRLRSRASVRRVTRGCGSGSGASSSSDSVSPIKDAFDGSDLSTYDSHRRSQKKLTFGAEVSDKSLKAMDVKTEPDHRPEDLCKDERLIDDAAPASDDEIGRLLGGIELVSAFASRATLPARGVSPRGPAPRSTMLGLLSA